MAVFIEGATKGKISSAWVRWWRSEGPFSRKELGAKTRVKLAGLKLLDLGGIPFCPEGSRLEVRRVQLLGIERAIPPVLREVLEDYEPIPYTSDHYERQALQENQYIAWVQGKKMTLDQRIDQLALAISRGQYQVLDLMRDLHSLLLLDPNPHNDFSFAAQHILELLLMHKDTDSLILRALCNTVAQPLLYPPREGYYATIWEVAVKVLVHNSATQGIVPLMQSARLLSQFKGDRRFGVAVDALGMLQARRAISLLMDLSTDPKLEIDVQVKSAMALGLMGTREVEDRLKLLLSKLHLVSGRRERFEFAAQMLSLGFRLRNLDPGPGKVFVLSERRDGPSMTKPNVDYYLVPRFGSLTLDRLLRHWSNLEKMVEGYLGLNFG